MDYHNNNNNNNMFNNIKPRILSQKLNKTKVLSLFGIIIIIIIFCNKKCLNGTGLKAGHEQNYS